MHLRQLRIALPLLAIAALALVVYWPGLSGPFLFDDFPNLVVDADWKVTAMDWAQWSRAMNHGVASESGRGLAMLSFAANHYFSGLDPWAMKLTNLAMHLANGGLVFLLCVRLFALAGQRGIPQPGTRAALTITAIWMLHPLQISSVLYVVQRMELGAQGFTLLSLLAYLSARSRQIDGQRAWPWLLASAIAGVLGLGFKESAALIPVYALLLEICLLRFAGPGNVPSRTWKALWLTGCAGAAVVFVALILPRYSTPEAYAFRDFSLGERLLTQPRMLAMYLGQILLPRPDAMLFYYDQVRASTSLLAPPATICSLGLLAALVAIAAMTFRTRPLLALGIGWFLAAHTLTSNVIPLELAFEHRNYLALLGVLIAIADLVARPLQGIGRNTRTFLAIALVVSMAGLTRLEAMTWGEPMRLATTLASRNPDSGRAGYALGVELLDQSRGDPSSPQWSLARKEFEHAATLPGSSLLGEQALIVQLGRANLPIPASVWAGMRAKLSARAASPETNNVLHTLVECRIRHNCELDDQELFATLRVALARNPNAPVVYAQYANFAFNVMRDPELAVRVMRDAVRLAPRDPVYRIGLIRMLLASNLREQGSEVDDLLRGLQQDNVDGRLDDDLRDITSMRSHQSTSCQEPGTDGPGLPVATSTAPGEPKCIVRPASP